MTLLRWSSVEKCKWAGVKRTVQFLRSVCAWAESVVRVREGERGRVEHPDCLMGKNAVFEPAASETLQSPPWWQQAEGTVKFCGWGGWEERHQWPPQKMEQSLYHMIQLARMLLNQSLINCASAEEVPNKSLGSCFSQFPQKVQLLASFISQRCAVDVYFICLHYLGFINKNSTREEHSF